MITAMRLVAGHIRIMIPVQQQVAHGVLWEVDGVRNLDAGTMRQK